MGSFLRKNMFYELKTTDQASVVKEYQQLTTLVLENARNKMTSLGSLLQTNLNFKRVFKIIHKEDQLINTEI